MCKFCVDNDDGEIISGNEYDIFGTKMSTSMFLNPHEKEIVFMIGDNTALIEKIEYCPFCGRKLSE